MSDNPEHHEPVTTVGAEIVATAEPVVTEPGQAPLVVQKNPSRLPDLAGPGVLLAAIVVYGLTQTRADILLTGTVALTYAIVATGFGLALGLAGEFLMALGGVFAVGAYLPAILTNHGWSYWPAAAAGVGIAVAVGLVVSLVGLRMSRFYFGMVGFFIVVLVPDLTTAFHKETGGDIGLPLKALPTWFNGQNVSTKGLFFICAFVLFLMLYLYYNIRRAPLGVSLRRMRDNPAAAATDGVPQWRIRLSAYIIGSFTAGVAGALYAPISAYLLPDNFNLDTTVLLMAVVIVGGSTALLGPTLGVIVLWIVPRVVIDVEGYTDIIYGAIVILAVIGFRYGIADGLGIGLRSLRRRLKGGDEAKAVPGSVPADVAPSVDLLVEELLSLRTGMAADKSLVAKGVRKQYEGVKALDFEDEDIVTIEPGTVHLLLGPNGSGKTTLLNTVFGMASLQGGTVTFGGRKIDGLPSWKISRAGIARSFQGPVLPAELTPVELLTGRIERTMKVTYGGWIVGTPAALRGRRDAETIARRIVTAAGLAAAADDWCSSLTSGQRRMLDVVYALASPAEIVTLDEPAAGLSSSERQRLGETIRRLAERGVGFLVVEHDLSLAMNIADHVSVLASGKLVAQGEPAAVQADPAVRSVLLGEVV